MLPFCVTIGNKLMIWRKYMLRTSPCLKDFSFMILVLPLLLIITLAGCTESKDSIVVESKKVNCTEKQTIKRVDYNNAIEKFDSRKTVRNFKTLSDDELKAYWVESAVLVSLFEDDLRACVIESDGSVSVKVWTQESVDSEYKMFEFLAKIIVSSNGNSGSQSQTPKSFDSGTQRQEPPKDKHTGLVSNSELT